MLGLGVSLSGSIAGAFGDFLPTDILSLSLWLKNNTGVTAAQWDDSSGEGRHVRQVTAGDQATVSEGGLDFTSSEGDHYDMASEIEIAAQDGFTVSFVIQLTSVSANMCVLGLNSTTHFLEFTNPSGSDKADKIRIRLGSTTTTINPDGDDQFGTGKMLITVVREAGATGNLLVYKNGSLLAQTSQAANTGDAEFKSLGTRNADRFLNGHIYELLVYKKAVSGDEITNLHNYLTTKLGL
tara:strand:- start:527 stop:1243 length:717 start_codon:yes stop_codon:yes gene_type:complete